MPYSGVFHLCHEIVFSACANYVYLLLLYITTE